MRGRFAYFLRTLFAEPRSQQPTARELELVEQIAAGLTKAKRART